MSLQYNKSGDTIVVKLSGKLNFQNSDKINREISSLIEKEQDLDFILNLSEVDFMSSSGLRIFINAWKAFNDRENKLILCSLNETLKKVFEIAEIRDLFEIFDSEEGALASLN